MIKEKIYYKLNVKYKNATKNGKNISATMNNIKGVLLE